MRVVEGILKMMGFGSKSSISFGFEFSWKIGKMSLVVHTARFFLSLGFFSEKDSFFSFFSNDSFDRDRGLEKCNIYNDISRRVS